MTDARFGYGSTMSENTEYPTGAASDPLTNREPADFEDPETFSDPDADPDMLNPRDLRDDGERVEEHLDPAHADVDIDADPESMNPRDDR